MKMKINLYGSILNLNEETSELTGKTFPVKNNLKYWGCTWNPTNKSWILPDSNKAEFIEKFAVKETKVEQTVKTHKHTGLCPICNSYCYGDCRSK